MNVNLMKFELCVFVGGWVVMDYMYRNGIFYWDIKLENIFIMEEVFKVYYFICIYCVDIMLLS